MNVRTIFHLYIEGYSILQIIKELQRKHIPSPSGKEKWNKRYNIYESVQFQKKRRSNVVVKADGTTARTATKYSGKRVVRETRDYYKLAAELGFDEKQTETFIKNIREKENRKP